MKSGACLRWVGSWVLLAWSLWGCASDTVGLRDRNCVAAYLSGAQQQLETEGQLKEIERALEDMLNKPPGQLRLVRYADYEGRPGQWTAVQLLHRYFVPTRDLLEEDCFYREVSAPESRAAIKQQLELLRRFPASTK